MGSCFSKKTTTTTAIPPSPQTSDHHQPPHNAKNDQPLSKKELFVIKHRVSHEIDRHSDQETDQNPNPSSTTTTTTTTATTTTTGTGAGAIILQSDRLSRSNSAGRAQNPSRRRRHSRSKQSFDLQVDTNDADAEDNDGEDVLDHQHRHRNRNRESEVRVSSSGRYSSKERRISISPSRGSSSKERRISISPSRRSESPFSNKNLNSAGAGSGNRPAKMVSVPATDKSNNAGVGTVKRINVKRNVSPARRSIRVFTDDQSLEEGSSSRDGDRRRKSLVEIDNNAGRRARRRDTKRTRKLSRDLDVNPETGFESFDPSPSLSASVSQSPPSYASLLLEDIQNFHKKNTTNATTTQSSFAIPECVSKACLIMEAVADMNSNTSSLCSDDRWRNQTTVKKASSETVVDGPV
ncbi:hypothetical protein Hdeb2414_s0016g00492801 [Helianthus debilis subsp. tardiflorus]